MIFTITLPAVKAAIAVGLLLLVLGLVYVLGYSIGHTDGTLTAYDELTDWFLHMLKDGDDSAE